MSDIDKSVLDFNPVYDNKETDLLRTYSLNFSEFPPNPAFGTL